MTALKFKCDTFLRNHAETQMILAVQNKYFTLDLMCTAYLHRTHSFKERNEDFQLCSSFAKVLHPQTFILCFNNIFVDVPFMQVGEDKEYSTLASVELRGLFPSRKINKVTEMNLSANQERADMEKRRLIWKVEGSTDEPEVKRGGPVDPEKLVVELAPMEIRTFLLDFDYLREFH